MNPKDADFAESPSLLKEIESKQEQLDELLVKLAKIAPGTDEESITAIGNEMCRIYCDSLSNGLPFRHQYHFFLDTLRSFQESDYVDTLMDNLKVIIEQHRGDKDALPKLLKLYDHIWIDVARMAVQDESHQSAMELEGTKRKIAEVRKESTALGNNIQRLRKKVESIQIETVAVLGVFAAIVIGFTGGLDIVGGALSNVGMKDFQLIAFSICLCSIVLFDTLWLLMRCVFRIVKDRKEDVVSPRTVMAFDVLMIAMMFAACVWQA